jgi:hypothetical protein
MKTSFSKILIAVFISAAFINSSAAQCSSVVKEALGKLTVYASSGQTNSATIEKGNKVEMHLSFYKGVNYKLQFGADKSLGQYSFRILDENKNELYKYDGSNGADYFTFFSNSSQELIVEMTAADNTKKGCVGVAVGMQVPKKSNSIRNL